METSTPALDDPRLATIEHRVVRHGRVASLEEAAEARGVSPEQVIKTMVVRVSVDRHIFVLVPGHRVIDWGKLRKVLGVRRLTMADAEEANAVTGYARGTITPFGSDRHLEVLADAATAEGIVSIGGGAPGVSISIEGAVLVETLGATVVEITKEPE